ncbi:ribbon-helix-helix protein, CopG family [Stakelama tenebrarum]|uniref:Ribbon-helix-helix protein, CopG family n=1 Tax=Stakelama tenebrarum TaxID=2711215 RepID=A0A6G6Y6A3_9SPHN|nr:ribbon-helix-helix protein, CopG family [Sphingosinithalassobacter tenebrarum]QIG80113.1 ribbon-helix-helix protein, CopG family [Sphingosinithalassobacter tenebrarum]
MAGNLDQLVQIRCDKAFIETLDEWRRLQPDLPSRAEAIRRLVRKGLDSEAGK